MPDGEYEERLRAWVTKTLRERGRGEPARLARHIHRKSSFVTMYTSGERDADLDLSMAIADYFGENLCNLIQPGTKAVSAGLGGTADAVTGPTIQALTEENTRLRGIIDRISDVAAELAVLVTIDKKGPSPRRKVARGARGARKDR